MKKTALITLTTNELSMIAGGSDCSEPDKNCWTKCISKTEKECGSDVKNKTQYWVNAFGKIHQNKTMEEYKDLYLDDCYFQAQNFCLELCGSEII